METCRERTGNGSSDAPLAADVSPAAGETAPTEPAPSLPELLRQEAYLVFLEHPTNFIIVFEAVRTETGAIRDWRFIDANRNVLRAFSTTRENLIGKCLSEIVGDRARRLIPMYAGVLETGVSEIYETTWGGADYLISVFPMGRNAVVTSGSDVTARKRAEGEVQRLLGKLSAERDWLLAALHSINDEVYFTDPEGRYLYANPAALRVRPFVRGGHRGRENRVEARRAARGRHAASDGRSAATAGAQR